VDYLVVETTGLPIPAGSLTFWVPSYDPNPPGFIITVVDGKLQPGFI